MSRNVTHLNREKIESNLSAPGIQGCHKNVLIKSLLDSFFFKESVMEGSHMPRRTIQWLKNVITNGGILEQISIHAQCFGQSQTDRDWRKKSVQVPIQHRRL